MVVELGDSIATIVPVFKGHAIPNLDKRLPFSGRLFSKQFAKALALRGYPVLESTNDEEVGREVKELCSYVALDPKKEETLGMDTTVLEENVHLVDGSCFSLGMERFEAVEGMFHPKLIDAEEAGLADAIFETFQEAELDCRVDLYKNIVLSGGMAGVPGLKERIEKGLNTRYKNQISRGEKGSQPCLEAHVSCDPSGRHHHLVFEGAIIFAGLINADKSFWVSQKRYLKKGAGAVLSKCQVF